MQHATRLAQMIHSHWLKHCPGLVEELTAKGRLAQALQETEERTADLLYELMSVKKMQYQPAWELATRSGACRGPKPSGRNPPRRPRA